MLVGMPVPEVKPTIVVRSSKGIQPGQLKEIVLGIEEEGVPYELHTSDELNPLVLAHTSAEQSVLGVGIGVSLDYAVVTTSQLQESTPYMATRLNQSCESDRRIGSNAGRLVKRMPLKLDPQETR